ncbi:O-antigen polysaccharide polymerase Wzy [Prosthecochloris sp. ZM_2]|uniref:O-antigen polymerase n=1 Tax=Prosthecochloris sp. ZM_2 TaxID=2045206 RepID=UPI000DF78571|nr:O-antigen polymerase [Prosthecochloris sp. ZM_2]RNA65325.1 O-antigen polysaccharide polymerase Wzy [Prosthecochloris sp. ZM_2]
MLTFVKININERYTFFALFVVLFLLSFVVNFSSGEFTRIILFFSFSLYLLVLSFPFIATNVFKSYYNPIFFYFLWEVIQGLSRGKIFLGIMSINEHYACPGALQTDLTLLLVDSFILESLALCFLLFGFFIPFNVSFSRLRIPETDYLLAKSVFWVFLAGIGIFMLMNIGGGIQSVLIQRGLPDEQRISSQIGSHWNYLASIGVVVPVVWMACDEKVSKKKYFWVFVVLTLFLSFLSTGSRSGTILPLIIIGIVYSMQNYKLPYKAIFVGVIISFLLVGVLGQFRTATTKVREVGQIDIDRNVIKLIGLAVSEMQTRGAENNGQLAVLARVPEDVPHLLGKSYLSIPFVFLPRAIFGDKPDAGGKLNAKLIYNRYNTAIPPGAIGEAYWNYSYIGVGLVFFLYGFVLKIFYAFYLNNLYHPLVMVIYAYVLMYLRPSSEMMYDFFHLIVPVLFIYLSFVRLRFRFS